jgi:hypothetical protein
LCECVARATATGLRALRLPPMRDACEEAAAARLVPAVKYQRRSRPAHDWVSRAALKIVHARRLASIAAATSAASDSAGTLIDEEADILAVEMGAASLCSTKAADQDGDGMSQEEQNERIRLDKIAKRKAKRMEKEVYDDSEVMALARAIVDELKRQSSHLIGPYGGDESGEPMEYHHVAVAAARVAPDGQILITSVAHSEEMASKGLAMCAGCGQFYAVHGGGLRQHWARGGVEQACAAAAEAARSASMTDEEATDVIGRAKGSGTNAESSSWRGSGDGRPGPWREKKSNEQKMHPGLAAAAAGDVAGMAAAAATAAVDDDSQSGAATWDPTTSCDGYGSDALQWAAGGGHLAACHWLVLERGVQVAGTRRKDGRTPLHWAARNGHLEVCQWLVAQGGALYKLNPVDP